MPIDSAKPGCGWPEARPRAYLRPDRSTQGPANRTARKQSVSRNVWRTSIRHGEVVLTKFPKAEVTPGSEVRRAGSTGSRARLPVRSRWCPDRHRECPHQGMKGDVPRVPAATAE